jgi:hypothetical protein
MQQQRIRVAHASSSAPDPVRRAGRTVLFRDQRTAALQIMSTDHGAAAARNRHWCVIAMNEIERRASMAGDSRV